jgi:diguanylate cyclase (GGDEF)-like protein/PAS domain S-box-containing protein
MKNKPPDRDHTREMEEYGFNRQQEISPSPKSAKASGETSVHALNMLFPLQRLTTKVLTFRKVDDLLMEVITAVEESLGYGNVIICLADDAKKMLNCRASAGDMQKFWELKRDPLSLKKLNEMMLRGQKISTSYYLPLTQQGDHEEGKTVAGGTREHVEETHPFADTIFVPMMDRKNEMFGLLAVRHSGNGNAPSVETVEMLEIFTNITGAALQKADVEKEAIEARNCLTRLTNYAHDAILTVDLDGTVRAWNEGAEKLYGYRREEVIRRQIEDIVMLPEQKGRFKSLMKKLAEHDGPIESEDTRVGKDGRIRMVKTTCFPYFDAEGYVTGLTLIDRDIPFRESMGDELKRTSNSLRHELKIAGRQHLKTLRLLGSVQKENIGLEKLIHKVRRAETELKLSNKKLEELSTLDDLTKLYNRRQLNRKLGEEMKRSNRFRRPMSYIMMDIDHFKEYNDTFGHIPGDNILKELAQLLVSNVREIDFVARYGGDEFCILLPETDAQDGMHQAERIRNLVDTYPFEGQESVPGASLTVSIGVSVYPEDAHSKVSIVECADQALYAAKKAGGNRVVRYEKGLEDDELILT